MDARGRRRGCTTDARWARDLRQTGQAQDRRNECARWMQRSRRPVTALCLIASPGMPWQWRRPHVSHAACPSNSATCTRKMSATTARRGHDGAKDARGGGGRRNGRVKGTARTATAKRMEGDGMRERNTGVWGQNGSARPWNSSGWVARGRGARGRAGAVLQCGGSAGARGGRRGGNEGAHEKTHTHEGARAARVAVRARGEGGGATWRAGGDMACGRRDGGAGREDRRRRGHGHVNDGRRQRGARDSSVWVRLEAVAWERAKGTRQAQNDRRRRARAVGPSGGDIRERNGDAGVREGSLRCHSGGEARHDNEGRRRRQHCEMTARQREAVARGGIG
ncbi:hypothetical protein DENSPDRAFT_875995 [Dentipellis sp. KUC8613]|nr:hypothetical protein DENSPDRAFT_875995 [Dentipellis sp. KUC8613]